MEMKKYPVGRQDFKGIITEGFTYVDKTAYIHALADRGGYYSLSRPRRFGKSLLVSTMEYLFQGEKALFEGLYIEKHWEFQAYPVIKISFADLGYQDYGLREAIQDRLVSIAESNQIHISGKNITQDFRTLIHQLYEKSSQPVVILIDEYDKPIIDYLSKSKRPIADENRRVLKAFYSVLKDADRYLKLLFITGVSKFSKVSIFSDLNNVEDISLLPSYNAICGITQKELEDYFPLEMQTYDREGMRQWYNGYRWDIDEASVYNPFSILSFFKNGGKSFQNYWFETGSPSFLIDLSFEKRFYDFSAQKAKRLLLSDFNIHDPNLLSLLFQTGYLTIKKYRDFTETYVLDYPNREVEAAYTFYLLGGFTRTGLSLTIQDDIFEALEAQDPEALKQAINSIFSMLPYSLWHAETERFFHAIVHLSLKLLGMAVTSEVHTKNGRADAMFHFNDEVFCLEFKLDQSAEKAIAQIKDRAYCAEALSQGKTCHLIGVNFSKSEKAVEVLLWEHVKG